MAARSSQSTPAHPDKPLVIVLAGCGAPGNTSIMNRFAEDKFTYIMSTTVGIDPVSFTQKMRSLKVFEKDVKLRIIDTSCRLLFRSISLQYISAAQGLLFVFNMTDRHSFDDAIHYIKSIREHEREHLPKCLVGNKSDLESSRVVSIEEAVQFANKYNMQYIECSAKTGYNIKEVFELITSQVLIAKMHIEVQIALFGGGISEKLSFLSQFIGSSRLEVDKSQPLQSVSSSKKGKEIVIAKQPVRVKVLFTADNNFSNEYNVELLQQVLGCIVLIDVTDRARFNSTITIVREIMEAIGARSLNLNLFLVSFKGKARRVISTEEVMRFAATYGIPYFEESSQSEATQAIELFVSMILRKERLNKVKKRGKWWTSG